jgi:hypothetical protein
MVACSKARPRYMSQNGFEHTLPISSAKRVLNVFLFLCFGLVVGVLLRFGEPLECTSLRIRSSLYCTTLEGPILSVKPNDYRFIR